MSARSVRVIVIAAVVLAAAYTAAAWIIGINVQSQLQREEQRAVAQDSAVSILQRSYQRGIYGASEQITYGVSDVLARTLARTPAGALIPGLRVTVRNSIHYGPLPQLRTVALATVDSSMQWPASDGAAAAPAGAVLMQAHTTLGWSGSSRSLLTSAARSFRSADGARVDWRGLSGTVTAARGLRAWTAALSAPGLTISGADARVSLSLADLHFDAALRRAFGALSIGHSSLTLGRLQVTPANGMPLLLQGLTVGGDSSVQADYVDLRGQLGVDRIQSAQFSATQVGYAVSCTHLHGPSLATLVQAMRRAQSSPGAGGGAAAALQMLAVFRQYGGAVLAHEPVLQITRIGFVTPQGELRLSARMTVPALTGASPSGDAALAAVSRNLQAVADLRVDTALADALLGRGGQGAALLQTQMQQLERVGYLQRDGSAYRTHIDYRAGNLRINGLPYPPAPPTPPTLSTPPLATH
jgi:uncharacterized protein YdgA (DUF945 family)